MTRRTIPLDAPTGVNRYLAALVLLEHGRTADFETLVAAVVNRLSPKHARSRALNAVNAMIHRGNIKRDGETLRLVQMPAAPLTPAEIEQRKAARLRAVAASSRRAVRIPAPADQAADDITLGVGRYAEWSPRSLLAAGELHYLLWFVGRRHIRQKHRDGYRAACAALSEYLRYEAQRP